MERALDWQQEAGDRSWTSPVLSGTRLRPESPTCSWGARGFPSMGQHSQPLGVQRATGGGSQGRKEVAECLEVSQPGLFWVPSQSWVRARCHELRQPPLPSCRQELPPTPTPAHLACHHATPHRPLPSGPPALPPAPGPSSTQGVATGLQATGSRRPGPQRLGIRTL